MPESTDDVVISPGDEVTFSGNSDDSACQDIVIEAGAILRLSAGAEINMVVEGDVLTVGPSTASRYDTELDLLVTGVSGNEITLDRTLVDAHVVGK